MKYEQYPSRSAKRNYFPLPNEIFSLGLSTGEIATYAYLMRCEDRETYQCYPSYETIGEAIGKTKNTVMNFVYKNKDFNQFKDKNTPLKAFGYYYIDENGKKVDLSWDKAYTGSKGTKFTPNVWFMIQSGQKLSKFKSVSSKVIPIIVLVVVVLLIYLWFRSWCKREDARMEAMYGKKEDRHKTGNKKKKTK